MLLHRSSAFVRVGVVRRRTRTGLFRKYSLRNFVFVRGASTISISQALVSKRLRTECGSADDGISLRGVFDRRSEVGEILSWYRSRKVREEL